MLIEKELFDTWASKYEKDIHDLKEVYPFAGYFDVVAHIGMLLKEKDAPYLLDLGVGTGLMLSELIEGNAYRYMGCDFSPKMVEYAKKRLNSDQIFVHDIREKEIPETLVEEKFDMIYSAYTFHHFETPLKIDIIKTFFRLLNPEGSFIIADISFDDEATFNNVKIKEGNRWDGEEDAGYFRKDDFINVLNENGFDVVYTKISYCAGIYDIRIKG